MSDFPRPRDASTPEAASRRGTPAACPPPPVTDPEQGARDTCEPSPVPTNNCEATQTLEGLATPQPAAPSGMPKSGRARGGRALRRRQPRMVGGTRRRARFSWIRLRLDREHRGFEDEFVLKDRPVSSFRQAKSSPASLRGMTSPTRRPPGARSARPGRCDLHAIEDRYLSHRDGKPD